MGGFYSPTPTLSRGPRTSQRTCATVFSSVIITRMYQSETDFCCYNGVEMIDATNRSTAVRQYGPFRLPKSFSNGDHPRVRFSICLGLFGGLLGGAVSLITPLTTVDPYITIPQHPPFGQALIIAMPGFLSGLAVAGPLAYILFGPPFTLNPKRTRSPRSLPIWLFIGFGYSLVFSLVLGGLFLPYISLFQDFIHSLLSVPHFLSKGLDMTISLPYLALITGLQIWFTSLFIATLFSVGGWIIDRFNTSSGDTTSKVGTWIIAALLCGIIIVLITLVPGTTLARLG